MHLVLLKFMLQLIGWARGCLHVVLWCFLSRPVALYEGRESQPDLLFLRHLPLHVHMRHELLQNAQRMLYTIIYTLQKNHQSAC